MQKKCNFCESYYDDALKNCPNCGAPNDNIRKSSGVPRTIEDLKQWYIDRKLPPKEVTRFFIGENYKGKQAFGIYKDEDTGNFVVYKNKSDGSRAIRYDGKDESYAVNEIYVKLKEQIAEQKSKNAKPQKKKDSKIGVGYIILIILFLFLTVGGCGFTIISCMAMPSDGYYTYQNDKYVYNNGHWYLWNPLIQDWDPTTAPSELNDNHNDYYDSYSYDTDSGYKDFKESDNYVEPKSYWDDDDDDSWDSDSDWDSDYSWDSGSDSYDWDSDW